MTLQHYRERYAQYRLDPDLQAAHAAFPWIVTSDDHEVDNNYAGEISENNDPRDPFLARRAAAYQAYYEHMPLRRRSIRSGTTSASPTAGWCSTGTGGAFAATAPPRSSPKARSKPSSLTRPTGRSSW